MRIKNSLKAWYRRHADLYPNLYNAQQRYTLLLRGRLNYVHENDFRALPLLGMPAKASCIDVGGNRGQSITAIKGVLPYARVVSFEPNPIAYSCLQKIAKRLPGVTTHNLAIGASNCETAMFIPYCRGVVFDQLASTQLPDPTPLAQTLRNYGFSFASNTDLTFERIAVQVKKLDCFRLAPDFIKIDVEGSELEVLKGAERTLQENKPTLLIERGARKDIESFLSALKYRRYVYVEGALAAAIDQRALNHFYINEDRAAHALP